MNEKVLHQIISDYRDEFADPNNKVPDPDRKAEVEEYMKLLRRLLKWLSEYSDSEVRGMFDRYIQDGGVYVPTAAGQLLKYKPVKEAKEGPYIPTYEETLEINKRLEAEEAERNQIEKNMTAEMREQRERERREIYEKYKAIRDQQSKTKRFGRITFDFSDSESDDS